MVYFSDLNSVIESIYLSETLGEKIGTCNIFINPENISYLIGKVVIINKLDYPENNIIKLISNRCKVISRIYINMEEVSFQPYILYPEFNIMWNGCEVDLISDILSNCSFDLKKLKLFFPKVKSKAYRIDDKGNLTALGWALQQVGVNIIKDTPFIDLDILKIKKMQF